MEQIVAGVRIGIEQMETVIGAIDEALDRLRPLVAQLLSAAESIAPGFALYELLGQHAIGAQLAITSGTWMNGCPR